MTKLSTFPQMATAQFSPIYYQEAIFTPPSEESNPTLSCTAYLRENARARIVTSLVKPDWRHFLGKNDGIGSIWSRCALFAGRLMLGFRAHVGFDFHDKRHHKRLKYILTKSESIEQSCVDSWRSFSWKQHRIMVNWCEDRNEIVCIVWSTSLRLSCLQVKNTILVVSLELTVFQCKEVALCFHWAKFPRCASKHDVST